MPRLLKSPKQLAWGRYVESRFGKSWERLDMNTQNALKTAWYAGYQSALYFANKKPGY